MPPTPRPASRRRRAVVGTPAAPSEPAVRPLLVTDDEQLLDDLLRLAAAAGAEADVAVDAGAARARWSAAPLVLVGGRAATDLAALAPPRRPGVLLVGTDEDDAAVWERGVALGAEHVVFLPESEPWLVDRLADAVEGAGEAVLVGVVGGRGGAGASVLAAALAVTAARRDLVTCLVDVDPLGGGIDLVLGAEGATGLRWQDLVETRGRVGGAALRGALPHTCGLTVLSWDRAETLAVPPEAATAVLSAVRRGSDLVIADLPRRVDVATEHVLARCTTTLLVVPAEVRAVAAAARVAAGIALVAGDVRVVVRGPGPAGLGGEEVAAALGLPLAGEMRGEPGLAVALDRGEAPGRSGRGPLAALCGRLLDDLVPRLQAA